MLVRTSHNEFEAACAGPRATVNLSSSNVNHAPHTLLRLPCMEEFIISINSLDPLEENTVEEKKVSYIRRFYILARVPFKRPLSLSHVVVPT